MLIDVSTKDYRHKFPFCPHPFISETFIELVKAKAGRVVRLLEDQKKVSIGLVAGIKDGILISPFSAPFGGFHFRHNNIFPSEIDRYITQLIIYGKSQKCNKLEICLPPDIYHHSFNSKMSNSLMRNGFSQSMPEITNWVDLKDFNLVFSNCNSRSTYNQSLRNNLSFHRVTEEKEKEDTYNLVSQNRKRLGRPIYMTLSELLATCKLWPVDFFQVRDIEGNIVAGAIFYRGHANIVQGIFWGDNEYGRSLRAMNFCAYNLWTHYKKLGYKFIDLGISTEDGVPNDGLIRFKEDLDCISSLRLSFFLKLDSINQASNDE